VTEAAGDGLREIADRLLHVRRHRGPAPTVVLCSALGAVCTDWDAVVALLPGADVLVFDRPGMGHSPPPAPAWPHAPPPTLDDEVQLIADVCESVAAAPPYVLVGHSSGGLFAQAFARMHPHLTAGLVLVDSSLPEQASDSRQRTQWLRAAFLHVPVIGAVGPLLRRLLVWLQTHHGTDPLPRAERRASYRSPSVLRTVLAELDGFDAAARQLGGLATVPLPHIPITVVAAGNTGRPWRRPASGSLREQADLARLLGASVYRPVDDAAHLVPLDRPDAVAEEIRAVLRAVHHGS
jgi:pimeloyl-ACP methyl ester carboxylesterase